MNARELELATALKAIELQLLAAIDQRTAALWSMLPPPPVGEIDAAQERGEVAKPGGDRDSIVQASDNRTEATYEDLGLSRQRVAEWRELRDAAQERGEVATPKDGAAVRDLVRIADKVTPATYDELGLSRQRVAEWRELRDAGEVAA